MPAAVSGTAPVVFPNSLAITRVAHLGISTSSVANPGGLATSARI